MRTFGGLEIGSAAPSVRHNFVTTLLVTAVFWSLSGTATLADTSYQLGHGYDAGPFNFAGYSDVVANLAQQGQKSLALDDLSLFVTGHIGKYFNPFVEAEFTHFDLLRSGQGGTDHGDGSFALERLYNDAFLSNSFTLRLGKMLAPVGEWNQIHAAPLVLTTVRPAVTYRNFSEYLTGTSLIYSDPDGDGTEIQLYWQPDGELSERPSSLEFDQYKMVKGIHVKFPFSLLDQIGFSYQGSKDVLGTRQSLFGVDFQYSVKKITLQGETTYSQLSGDREPGQVRSNEWGGYFAATYHFSQWWSAYSWYEEFAARSNRSVAHDALFGVAFRPQSAIVLKLEYLQNVSGQEVNPTGLFASWSVLF